MLTGYKVTLKKEEERKEENPNRIEGKRIPKKILGNTYRCVMDHHFKKNTTYL
jgi:hypothetical protein